MARRKAREHALQMLFEWDLRRNSADEVVGGFYGALLVPEDSEKPVRSNEFAVSLVRGVISDAAAVDAVLGRNSSNWRIERMPAVDRNILRLAVWELLRTDTAAAVVIDEAVELTRRFAGEESVKFVNGVLDAASREIAAAK